MGGRGGAIATKFPFVGLGWVAPPSVVSGQLSLWDGGLHRPESGGVERNPRASLYREMRYLLSISTESGRVGRLSPAGLAHSLGVCLIEDSNMARGKGNGTKAAQSAGMPRFVDVKITAEQRAEFTAWEQREGDLVTFLQSLADDGYRVGVTWSGEQQAYTVSLTGRGADCPNNGLCMTSFAKTLPTALWLAIYKHTIVCEERWLDGAFGDDEEFG